MKRLAAELADKLHASLEEECGRRCVTKAALIVEGIGLVLRGSAPSKTDSMAWLEEWSGSISEANLACAAEDPRLAGILAEHLK